MDDQHTEEPRKRLAAQKLVEQQQQQKAALQCLQLQKALGAELPMVKLITGCLKEGLRGA